MNLQWCSPVMLMVHGSCKAIEKKWLSINALDKISVLSTLRHELYNMLMSIASSFMENKLTSFLLLKNIINHH